jgi:hypothetical protein
MNIETDIVNMGGQTKCVLVYRTSEDGNVFEHGHSEIFSKDEENS